jgi:hypothetical protein
MDTKETERASETLMNCEMSKNPDHSMYSGCGPSSRARGHIIFCIHEL